jgi:phenylpyruvate tautomerase PptA (4-oxalocrotonate tautomerase family)
MPKINLKCPVETFSTAAKAQLAEDFTTIGTKLEKLPDTSYVRGNVWIYFEEYPADNVFHGGKSGGTKIISVEVNALKGGLDDDAKISLIEQFTAAIRKHAGIADNNIAPVFIVIREVEESDWGIFGKTTTLEKLRNPPADANPLP